YGWLRERGISREVRKAKKSVDLVQENARLRAELRRAEEERDILKRPPRTLPRGKGKVRLHAGPSAAVSGRDDVPGAQGGAQRLLRMAEVSAVGTCQRGCALVDVHRGVLPGLRWRVRQS